MRQKITMITLGVADIQRSRSFYEGLGWTASPKSMEDLILFDLGGMLVALYPRHELAADMGVPAEGQGFTGITLSQNTFNKAEVDAVLADAARLGGRVVKPAQEVFWGGYSGYFSDPDGHMVEVAYNPFWPLNEVGDVVLG